MILSLKCVCAYNHNKSYFSLFIFVQKAYNKFNKFLKVGKRYHAKYHSRIDKLPSTPMLRKILLLVGIGWMFDAMDQGMVAGVMAAIGKDWALTQPTWGCWAVWVCWVWRWALRFRAWRRTNGADAPW